MLMEHWKAALRVSGMEGSLARNRGIRDGRWGWEHVFFGDSSHFLGHVSYTVTEGTARRAPGPVGTSVQVQPGL